MKCFYLLLIFFASCSTKTECIDLTPIEGSYSGNGYLLNFQTSQDGMGDIWYFPCCKFGDTIKPVYDSQFLSDLKFCNGISFKLPVSGNYYKNIKSYSNLILLDSLSYFSKVWITPVALKIKIDKNATLNETKTVPLSKFTLRDHAKIQSFFYYNINEFEIESLEVKGVNTRRHP